LEPPLASSTVLPLLESVLLEVSALVARAAIAKAKTKVLIIVCLLFPYEGVSGLLARH
jgi:hypothetical protein